MYVLWFVQSMAYTCDTTESASCDSRDRHAETGTGNDADEHGQL